MLARQNGKQTIFWPFPKIRLEKYNSSEYRKEKKNYPPRSQNNQSTKKQVFRKNHWLREDSVTI